MTGQESRQEAERSGRRMECEDIQALLFDYMAHELGEGRAVLVREHLRKCPVCAREAAEIRETLEVLKLDSKRETGRPERLSDDRRRRLARAYFHPVLDWIYVHHVLVSVLLAFLALLVAGGVLLHARIRRNRPVRVGPSVLIDGGPREPPAPSPPEKTP